LTRLTFSGATRVAFCHPLPELRVLDWRGSSKNVTCVTFWTDDVLDRGDDDDDDDDVDVQPVEVVERRLSLPLAIPSADIAPKLSTLLVGYDDSIEGLAEFDLWTLVAARTALRVVVIENAHLLCSAPAGFDTTTAGFAALLARVAKDLVSVHTHNCVIEGAHQPAVENFLLALEQSSVRVCRAGVDECLFCLLHDDEDTDGWW
jgi:hypothetical protein